MDGEEVQLGGRRRSRPRPQRDPVPTPLIALAVVLVAAVALGAWLNDAGPWATTASPVETGNVTETGTADTGTAETGTVVVVDPSTGSEVPLGDFERTTGVLRRTFGTALDLADHGAGNDGSWDSELTGRWPRELRGMCSMTVEPGGNLVRLYWKDGAVPLALRQRIVADPHSRITVAVESTTSSRADITRASDAIISKRAEAALRQAGRAAGTGVPRGLDLVLLDDPDPQRCGGIAVGYGRRGQPVLPDIPRVDGAVEKTLEPYLDGVLVQAGPVALARTEGMLPAAGQ